MGVPLKSSLYSVMIFFKELPSLVKELIMLVCPFFSLVEEKEKSAKKELEWRLRYQSRKIWTWDLQISINCLCPIREYYNLGIGMEIQGSKAQNDSQGNLILWLKNELLLVIKLVCSLFLLDWKESSRRQREISQWRIRQSKEWDGRRKTKTHISTGRIKLKATWCLSQT